MSKEMVCSSEIEHWLMACYMHEVILAKQMAMNVAIHKPCGTEVTVKRVPVMTAYAMDPHHTVIFCRTCVCEVNTEELNIGGPLCVVAAKDAHQ